MFHLLFKRFQWNWSEILVVFLLKIRLNRNRWKGIESLWLEEKKLRNSKQLWLAWHLFHWLKFLTVTLTDSNIKHLYSHQSVLYKCFVYNGTACNFIFNGYRGSHLKGMRSYYSSFRKLIEARTYKLWKIKLVHILEYLFQVWDWPPWIIICVF